MEPMEIAIATFRDLSYLIVNHPVYSLFGVFIGIIALVSFYCRLTLGMCDCDQDLEGKTVLITGGNAGIGKATAEELARRNARIILGCRSEERGRKAVKEIVEATGNKNVFFRKLDLCSFASVRVFAKEFLKSEKKLHILINNAGITGNQSREVTEDGLEKVMQSNHLGHFLLTMLLLDLLKKTTPSRIINVSSMAYKHAKVDLDDLQCISTQYGALSVYGRSKMANILFTKELAQRLNATGVTVNSLHPGAVKTEIMKGKTALLVYFVKLLFVFVGKSPKEGAQTSIHLALSPALENVTGKFFSDCKEQKLHGQACSEDVAKGLWKLSESLVGLNTNIAQKQ